MSASRIPIEALSAAFPANPPVGDWRLPPLTLQHVFALGAIESPVMDEHATTVSLRDMATAIALMMAAPEKLTPLIADALYGGEASAQAKGEIRKLAIDLAARVPIERLPEAFAALQRQLAAAWSTFVPMTGEGAGAPLPAGTGAPSAKAPATGPGRSS